MKATDLSIGDIGGVFRSLTYPNKNKTAKPNPQYDRESGHWIRKPGIWVLGTLWAHENGNIKINNDFHLRPDTELERIEN